jgi:hypothetical protein
MLKPLIEKDNKKAKIKRALADGAFDSRENFNYSKGILLKISLCNIL